VHPGKLVLALSPQTVERHHATEPVFSDIDKLLVRHRKVYDNAEDHPAVPIDPLRTLEKTLDVFAVYREFVGEVAVNKDIGDGGTLSKNEKSDNETDAE
jgi:hypothetical protein